MLDSPEKPFRFFVLTCRDSATDFRLPLVTALRRDYETYYIWLKRQPVLTYPDGHTALISFVELLSFLRRFKPDGKINVFFNTTNTSFPFITAFLRLIAPRGIWCLDMHDDLRYHYTGLARLRTVIGIRVMQWFSDLIVHAAPTLQELFPASQHLGNASHISPMSHEGIDRSAVLILASLDDRFDFDLMEQVAEACPANIFHIHGQVYDAHSATLAQVEALTANHGNIQYHGAYTSDDLPCILGRYAVTFAPYHTGIELTRYIDPLRYYHCLNAGLKVITTAIPQALLMQKSLTLIDSAEECAHALKDADAAAKPYACITWEQRVDKLIGILRALPKTIRLAA
ncbi:MAG: hypothetical protein P4M13_01040 [Alphaproteobacteria bacterium]|nr:hypothetical protein [Alphaproteobacteria bacterium]